jgi:hypothetical protein
MAPNYHKEEETFVVDKKNTAKTEFSSQLNTVSDSNENSIQPGIYILIEYRHFNHLNVL